MNNTGRIIALDKSGQRLKSLNGNHYKELVENWGITCIESRKLDALKVCEVYGEGVFDRVLLDAPCTGLGQRPRLCYEELKIAETAVYQKNLLEAACKALKPGGRLVYSTCSIAEEGNKNSENQENTIWAVSKLPLVLQEQELYIGSKSYPENLTQVFSPLEFTGFFIAQFLKV